ncbi:hypothetical protein AURANDRAFT_69324, partial [Aureococcus anophagefferens]
HCIADSPTVHSARAIGLVLAALATAKGLELTAVLKYTVASRGLGHAMWSCDYHTMGAALIRLFKMLRPSRLRGPAPDPSTFLTLSKDIIGQTNMCIKNLDDVAVELMHWSQYKIYSLLPPSILRAVLNNWPKNGGNKFNRLFPALGPEERKAIKAALNL